MATDTLELSTYDDSLSGRYKAQGYGVNGRVVFEKQGAYDLNMGPVILYYTWCRDDEDGTFMGSWIMTFQQILAEEMKATPGVATGCSAFMQSMDWRPEAPEKGKWWTPTLKEITMDWRGIYSG